MAIIPAGNSTSTPGPIQSQVVCNRSNWYTILWFYFANYVLHALSVRSLPGENFLSSVTFKLCCLFIPFTGIRRGLCLISRASNLDGDRLQAAARANALCMVIRNEDWRPENGEVVSDCRFEKLDSPETPHISSDGDMTVTDKEIGKEKDTRDMKIESVAYGLRDSPTALRPRAVQFDNGCLAFKVADFYEPNIARGVLGYLFRTLVQTYRFRALRLGSGKRLDINSVKIHGLCKMPHGYSLSLLPEDVKVFPRRDFERPGLMPALLSRNLTATTQALVSETKVANANNTPRILFSLMQTVSSAYALYQAQGSQIAEFGYTAYGLTVLPYMIVSVFNIVGSLLTSEYEMLYLVHSSTMDEMVHRGGTVDGVVGTVNVPQGELDLRVDRIETSGSYLQFEGDEMALRFRDSTVNDAYSEALPVVSLPPPKVHTIFSAFYKSPWYEKRREKKRKKREEERRKVQELDKPEPNVIITVPAHGSLARVPTRTYQFFLNALTVVLLILAFAVPYLVIYALTGFKANHATSNYKSFMMNWLVEGTLMGYVVGSIEKLSGNRRLVWGLVVMFVSYGCYCLMGFVAVAQQMVQIGICTAI